MSVLVDWVSITDHQGLGVGDLLPGLVDADELIDRDRGDMGYSRGRAVGHITLLDQGGPRMGQHLVISGKGCRELEARGLSDWSGLFRYWRHLGVQVARLDVAFDDRGGILDLEQMHAAVSAGEVTSIFRKWRRQQSGAMGEALSGDTLYFGSRASDVMVRAYDKAAEQAAAVQSLTMADAENETASSPGSHWVRVELETHGARARSLAFLLEDPDQAAKNAAGVVRSYLDFKTPASDANKRRWASTSWWAAFLGEAEKVRLAIAPMVRNMETTVVWLTRQVQPILALYLEYLGGDLGPFLQWVKGGRRRWGPRHMALLAAA